MLCHAIPCHATHLTTFYCKAWVEGVGDSQHQGTTMLVLSDNTHLALGSYPASTSIYYYSTM